MNEEFLIFDLWGEMAHFRRYDTTSSPLSWPFPPRPTVFGILSAILGLDKRSYLTEFQDEAVTVAISLPNQQRPRSLRIAFNYTETKGVPLFRTTQHTQIRLEVLADVRYRIFFRHPSEERQKHLTELVRAHQSVYTVSLGLASMLADFAFIATAVPKAIEIVEPTTIVSVAPYALAQPVRAPDAAPLMVNAMPRQMTSERIVTAYQDVCYDARRPLLAVQPKQAPIPAYDFGEYGVVVPL